MSVAPSQTTRAVLARVLSYARPFWWILPLAILAMAINAATNTGIAAFAQVILDDALVDRKPGIMRWLPWALLGLTMFHALSTLFSRYLSEWFTRRVTYRIRGEAFERLAHLPTSYYDVRSTGEQVSKLTFNADKLSSSLAATLITLVRDALTIVAMLGWMMFLNLRLALLFFVVAPFIAMLMRYLNKKFRTYTGRILVSMGDVSRVAEEAISGHRVVKLFGGESYEIKRFEEANSGNFVRHMKFEFIKGAGGGAVQMLIGIAFVLVVTAALTSSGIRVPTPGEFTSFFTAMILLRPPLKRLTDVYASITQTVVSANTLFDIIDTPQEAMSGAKTPERIRGDIEFKNVSFTYPTRDTAALNNVSFRIKPGETTAFVGQSGSGKSTIVSLLPRFYEPLSGSILLDDVPLGEYDIKALRDQMALVSQDITLFNDTIAHNIAYGALNGASMDEIVHAAKTADALKFIEKLPEGFDTVVGDRGVLLSGGQRQRIAIARAVLKDAPILILDEATSALDSQTERNVQAALDRMTENRTSLVVAHRLSTIESADTIYVLEKGAIVETGKHHELLNAGGAYAGLYALLQGAA